MNKAKILGTLYYKHEKSAWHTVGLQKVESLSNRTLCYFFTALTVMGNYIFWGVV